MRKALIHIVLLLCAVSLSAQQADTSDIAPKGKVIPMEGAFIRQLQERDSVLVADQIQYGFELKGVTEGTRFAFPELPEKQDDRLMFLTPWRMDTLKVTKSKEDEKKKMDLKGSIVISSFEEGIYELPQIAVQRMTSDGVVDTLVFDPIRLEVKTMPVDTSTFVPHDIKGQIRYPLTFDEVMPYVAATWLLAAMVIMAVCLIVMRRRRNDPEYIRRDPAHIVALRKLDGFRGSKMWAPEKQKAFYSGVTDALREYIAERYDIGAMEMTTAEIFALMKDTDAPKELLAQTRELFERADFVKFAKYVASDEDNAAVLPVAVRFVTSTYQTDIESVEEQPVMSNSEQPVMSSEVETSNNGGKE